MSSPKVLSKQNARRTYLKSYCFCYNFSYLFIPVCSLRHRLTFSDTYTSFEGCNARNSSIPDATNIVCAVTPVSFDLFVLLGDQPYRSSVDTHTKQYQ